MACSDIKEKLIDYIDKTLSKEERERINSHLKECSDCSKELKGLKDTISYVEGERDSIKVPKDIVKNINRDNLKSNVSISKVKMPFKVSLVAIALFAIFVVTSFAADELGILNWWKERSLKESQSIEELISRGYGDDIGISKTDNSIKITLESVVADDINTILMMTIEDLEGNRKLIPYYEGIFASGDFKLGEYEDNALNGDTNLYTEESNKSKVIINLKPLDKENGNIKLSLEDLIINQGKIDNKGKVVKGNWDFEIPVTKHDSVVYKLDKSMKINNRDIFFDELVIAPTKTLLKYSYTSVLTKDLSDFSIIAKDKEYKSKRFGFSSSSSHSSTGENSGTVEFDSMYFDNVDNVNIKVNSYVKEVLNFAEYDIALDKGFPQEFEYMGSKIAIENIVVGEETTKVIMTESLENRKYERLEFEFKDEEGNYYPFGDTYDGYVIDSKGKKVKINEYWFNDEKLDKPRIYPTKHNIELYNIRNKYNERKKGEFIPSKLKIKGYHETVYIDKGIKIKLKEDMIVK